MFGLFATKPLFDEGTTLWLFDAYAWALENFGSDIFYHQTQLITPSDQFFPDRIESPQEMLIKLFDRVRGYAQMEHWPCELVPSTLAFTLPAVTVSGAPRGPGCEVSINGETQNAPITFDPQQIRNPPVLIARFAQELAAYLGRSVKQAPPSGEDYRGHASDLLAVFMGFGLFLANNAFTITKGGGCSGCGISAQCMGSLTEEEFTYALAIFAALKDISHKEVEGQLKSSVRAFYRKAVKELGLQQAEEMARLRGINRPLL